MSLGRVEDFALERYFARFEFAVKHQLSASDVEPYTLREILAFADDDTRERWNTLSLGYTEAAGLPALREEIASMYQHVSPSEVFVLAGAEEGILLTMHAALSAGDEAIVVTPAYQSLHALAVALGATVKAVPLRPDQHWQLDPDEVARAVTRRTRLIVVNFPHNPTGAHIAQDVQRRLVDIAESSGVSLFSDEVYRGLEHGDEPSLPAAADLSAGAISLGVMSKAFALAGLRIGWIATRNARLLAAVTRMKDYTTICNSAPSELLALMALRARSRVLDRSRFIVRENLSALGDFLSDFQDRIQLVAPRAGSTAFPSLRIGDADTLSRELIERESVLLMPGSVFGYDRAYFRLGLGRRDFPLALQKVGRVLRGT
jgi:aspartate/methionine/tyrosine aminotransferase